MNLYKRPMFMQQGGAATPRLPTPMANMPMARAPSGAMPPMRPSNAPMAPAPRIPAAPSRPKAPADRGIGSMIADKAKADLATAQGPEELINAFRGNKKPISARYQELAEYVGPNDASRTPTSVLTMVQPTIMMTEKGAADSGIGQLMAGMPQANAPMQGNMGSGIMQRAPVRLKNGGSATLRELYEEQLPLYRELFEASEAEQALQRRAIPLAAVQAGLNLAAGKYGPQQNIPTQLAGALQDFLPSLDAVRQADVQRERVAREGAIRTASDLRQAQIEANYRAAEAEAEQAAAMERIREEARLGREADTAKATFDIILEQEKARLEGMGFEPGGPTDIVGATGALTFLDRLPKPLAELEGNDLQQAQSAISSLAFNLGEIAKPRYVQRPDLSGYDVVPGIIPEYVRNRVQTLMTDGKLPPDFALPAQTSLPPGVPGAQVPGAETQVSPRDQTPDLVPVGDTDTKRVGNVDVPVNVLQIAETADETLQQRLMLDPEIADVFGPAEAIKGILGRIVTVPADVGQSLGIPGSKTLFEIAEGSPQELQLVSDLDLFNTELMNFFLATRQGKSAVEERANFAERFPKVERFGDTYNDALAKYESLLTFFSRNAAEDVNRLENLARTPRTTTEIQDIENSLQANVRAATALQAIIQGMRVRQSSSEATAASLQDAERRVQGRDLIERAKRAAFQ